jgi:predicted ATP-grasp superfamily ATP-dependent carboligase
VTQQLLGGLESPFAYRGSIGPWPINSSLAAKLGRLGDAIASGSGLLGWFGVDYVLRDGDPWPVEVNPRYTASVEIHELALGRALLCEHRRACEGGVTVAPAPPQKAGPPVIAKVIVRARRDFIAPAIDFDDDRETGNPIGLRAVADVPWPGTRFAAGDPVMTLQAWGENVSDCQSRLNDLERTWSERLGFTSNWVT